MHSTWRFNLRRFDPEPPAPGPKPDPPKPDPEPPKPEPEKSFNQADVDRIVSERLKRQKEQFGDYEEAKRKAAEYDKAEESRKSELEKAQARAEAAEKREAERTSTANERLIRGEVKAAAAVAGFVDPDDAFALIDRTDVGVEDDGTVKGVAEAVKALAERKPHLVTSRRPHPGGGDGGGRLGPEGDFRTADKKTFESELARHGLRARS